MAPTLIFQKEGAGKIFLAVGSPGGSTIPTTVLQVMRNVLDFGMNLTDAVNTGRVHHQLYPDEIAADPNGLDPATEQVLTSMGHKIHRVEPWGDAEAVMSDPATGFRYAASDSRNEGAAMGQD
jgi:gamma-glutamyltranspeptidase/glutathione hydrolase